MAFEKLKERYLRKLKKNTVISELRGEKVYLSKGSVIPFERMREWKQIYPAVDEVTGKINWINFLVGGKRNLVKLLVVLFIAALVLMQFSENYRLLGQAVECCNRCNGINLFP